MKNGITADAVEAMYRNAHAAIRADPMRAEKPAKEIKVGGRKERFVGYYQELLPYPIWFHIGIRMAVRVASRAVKAPRVTGSKFWTHWNIIPLS